MKNPKISIILPIYNSEKTIGEALTAIRSLEYKNYEVIIVDDNSSDNSVRIAEKFKFNIVKLKENHGAAEARNIGSRKASGELLLFTDADVILPKDTLTKAAKYYSKGKNIFIGMFSPKLRFKNIFSQYKHLYLCYYYLKQGEHLHTLDTSLTVIKRSIFEKHNGFDKTIRISEDAELGTRLLRAGETITQPKDLNMEHIKHYSPKSFVKTDYIRGKRFSKLLLNSIFKDKGKKAGNTSKKSRVKSFYLKPLSLYLSVGIMPFFLISLLFLIVFQNLSFFLISTSFFLLFILLNLEFWHYLKQQNGLFFALKSSFITFFDMVVFDVGITTTFLSLLFLGKKALT